MTVYPCPESKSRFLNRPVPFVSAVPSCNVKIVRFAVCREIPKDRLFPIIIPKFFRRYRIEKKVKPQKRRVHIHQVIHSIRQPHAPVPFICIRISLPRAPMHARTLHEITSSPIASPSPFIRSYLQRLSSQAPLQAHTSARHLSRTTGFSPSSQVDQTAAEALSF
jgi:hypothetical protein